MTAPEIQAETEQLRETLRKHLLLIESIGAGAPEARQVLVELRRDYREGRSRVLAEQKRTLTASLPPPARAKALRSLRLRLALLDTILSELDSSLSLEVAA